MYSKMLYRVGIVMAAMLVVAMVTGCSAVSAPAASASQATLQLSSSPANVRGITVVGTGKAAGTPDVANVSVGIETQADTVQQAVAENKVKMTKLLETLQAQGIADKDIQTTNYGVYTQREPGPEGKGLGPTTYHVNNQVNVTVRDVTKLGDILDKVVAAGANNVYGVNFAVDDTTKLQSDARAKAFADAKARADSLAKLAGVTLGEVVSVSEVIGNAGPMLESARMSVASGLGGGAPIQPGELQVNLSIQVTFAIK